MNEVWKDNFKSSVMRVGFKLSLTRSMLEYISAVSDDVWWNRSTLGACSADVDNFLATSRALILRGLIELKAQPRGTGDIRTYSQYKLTPAGELMVQLIKMSGMYVEADAVSLKKKKGKQ